MSCRIDESITLLYNTIHRLVWWIDKDCDEFIFFFLVFFLGKTTAFDLLVFCSLSYFLNNFSLLVGLWRLVCLLTVGTYLLHHDHRPAECSYTFSDDSVLQQPFLYCLTWNNNQFLILKIFSFLFLQNFLHINSISLCFDPWIFYHILANMFPSNWLFLASFASCECWLPCISCVMCHKRRE